MAQILDFPSTATQAWSEWERAVRNAGRSRRLADEVVEDALPRIKEHWKTVCAEVSLELPERTVPGELTKEQAVAIQALIDDASNVVLKRLKHERALSLKRLVIVELALSHSQASTQANE